MVEVLCQGLNLTAPLPLDAFGDPALLGMLFMDRNRMTVLPSAMMATAPSNVRLLSFSDNLITAIAVDAFLNFGKLENLVLDSNFLTDIPAGVFAFLPRLAVLSMGWNQLTRFPVLFSLLQQIKIPNNAITSIARVDLAKFNQTLETIFLGRNYITELPADLFLGFSTLRSVDFSYNGLTAVPDDFFASCITTLETVELKDNSLTVIPTSIVAATSYSLSRLGFKRNSIQEIPEQLALATKIIFLDLAMNLITRVPKGVFSVSPETKALRILTLNMAGNPSVCTLHSNLSISCSCFSELGGQDPTYCDTNCSRTSMPSISGFFQRSWNCTGSTQFRGDVCIAKCFVRGGIFPQSRSLLCGANGTWGSLSPSTSVSCAQFQMEPASQRGYMLIPASVTWQVAVELARTYAFGKILGQLALISTAAENDVVQSLFSSYDSSMFGWLGGARDELGVNNGIFWHSYPSYGVKLFSGPVYTNGSVNPDMYANFLDNQPDFVTGGLAITSAGKWTMRSKANTWAFIVMFLVSHNYINFAYPPLEACGPFSFCMCSKLSVTCPTNMLSVPLIPNGTKYLNIFERNFSFIPDQALQFSLESLAFTLCALSQIPVAKSPLLYLEDISFKSNKITSLGLGELATLGPNITIVNLEGNPISAVSDGALAGLPMLASWKSFSDLATCFLVQDTNTSTQYFECRCSEGYANDPTLPNYCVDAHFYNSCAANLQLKTVLTSTFSPRLSCTFPPRDPNNVTCVAVCPKKTIIRGNFTCLANGTVVSDLGVGCNTNRTGAGNLNLNNATSSQSSIVPIAAGTGAGGVAVLLVLVFVVLRSRRSSGSSLGTHSLLNLLHDSAKSAFLREYGHNVRDNRGFDFRFGHLQLPRKRVQLGREIERTGAIVVCQSMLLPDKRQVAVRYHESSDLDSQSAILREAMVLHLFRHDNILALLHVCSEQIPVLMVTDFMINGDLRTFLRACRPAAAKPRQVLTANDLFAIAQKTVAAMVFLESKHIIHRGLAAKHFLVGRDASDIRLANLGKSRDIYVAEVYLTANQRENKRDSSLSSPASPTENDQSQDMRWMAPECIRDAEYTHKSDVWAMGIVIYEITSFARSPYGSMSIKEITMEVGLGHRLEQPPTCTEFLYALMLRMWDAQPRQRPTFSEVQGELIMQMLPDAATLVQASHAATTGGLPWSWQQYTREQVKPIRAIGSHRVLLELPGGITAVAERLRLADLQAELLVWKTLQHENVVPFLGTCDATGLLLVAFQSQGSIRDLLSQRTLTVAQKLPMLLQTAVGLEFLHTRGVLHTRLTARSCLLTADLGVKLTGFSAAGLRRGGGSGGEPWCCPLARTTTEFSTASDVYSLAATVFEVLAFPALPPLDAGELRTGREGWPSAMQELVAQCAQRTPDARPSVGQCIVALELAHFGPDRWEFAPAQLVLLQELGSGQFGVVNKMAASGITRPGKTTLVAVKQLKNEAMPEAEADFLAEMQLMMKLRHPNLVGLLGVVTKSDPLMLILEFLPGGSLDNWLRTPRDASTEDLLYILYQVTLGMCGLHALGIVHRDLAARNVLVGVDLAIKVADYGLSREVTETKEYYRYRSNRPIPLRWTAPEVLRDRKWTRASDVYSFGIVVYEVFSGGQNPFVQLPDETVIKLLAASTSPVTPILFATPSPLFSAALFQLAEFWLSREAGERPPFEQIAATLHPANWPSLA